MGRFQPGQSGNPAGRPIGAKHKLSERFIEALHKDFEVHGVATIQKVREEKPDQYLKVVASLVPKDITVAVDPYEDMSDEELIAALQMVREALDEQDVDLDAIDAKEGIAH